MDAAPSRLRTLDLTYIALSAVLITVCAWISIPAPVPFTLQTFAVFFSLLALGGRRGMLAILTYLMMGAVGLPVFTGFRGGLGVLLGATGGYLLGFVVMALVYRLATRLGGDSLPAGLVGCLLGLVCCYAFGTAWYLTVYAATAGPVGLGTALGLCVVPFVIPDLLKLTLAAALTRRLKKHIHS